MSPRASWQECPEGLYDFGFFGGGAIFAEGGWRGLESTMLVVR